MKEDLLEKFYILINEYDRKGDLNHDQVSFQLRRNCKDLL